VSVTSIPAARRLEAKRGRGMRSTSSSNAQARTARRVSGFQGLCSKTAIRPFTRATRRSSPSFRFDVVEDADSEDGVKPVVLVRQA